MTSKQTLATELRRLADEIEFGDAPCAISSRVTRTTATREEPITSGRDWATSTYAGRVQRREIATTVHSISVTIVERGEWK